MFDSDELLCFKQQRVWVWETN